MKDLLRGELDLVILAVLRNGPLHGYAINQTLREQSDGDFDVLEGTLYPALHRLEAAGLVKSRWDSTSGRRRRVYSLTQRGQKELSAQAAEWRSFTRRLEVLLGRS
jgi:PadR family transcriptional regulator, regulatory protein PadR